MWLFRTVLLTTKSTWYSLKGLRTVPAVSASSIAPLCFLHSYGLSTAAADNFVFFNEDIQVAVYVDDLLIFGADKAKVQHLKNALNGRSSMKDLVSIKLSSKGLPREVLSRFDMLHFNADEIPMTVGQNCRELPSDYEAEGESTRTYQEAIGSLMYLMLYQGSHQAKTRRLGPSLKPLNVRRSLPGKVP